MSILPSWLSSYASRKHCLSSTNMASDTACNTASMPTFSPCWAGLRHTLLYPRTKTTSEKTKSWVRTEQTQNLPSLVIYMQLLSLFKFNVAHELLIKTALFLTDMLLFPSLPMGLNLNMNANYQGVSAVGASDLQLGSSISYFCIHNV